jgi:hypothetical protein
VQLAAAAAKSKLHDFAVLRQLQHVKELHACCLTSFQQPGQDVDTPAPRYVTSCMGVQLTQPSLAWQHQALRHPPHIHSTEASLQRQMHDPSCLCFVSSSSCHHHTLCVAPHAGEPAKRARQLWRFLYANHRWGRALSEADDSTLAFSNAFKRTVEASASLSGGLTMQVRPASAHTA